MATLIARDLMTQPVLTLRDDQTVREAAVFLTDKHIHGAPVVDADRRVVGVLTATDLARYESEREPDVVRESDYYHVREAGRRQGVALGRGFHVEHDAAPTVKDLMTPSVIHVNERAPLAAILRLLLRHRIHRVMVVRDPGRTLVGVVSETDVMTAWLRVLTGRRSGRRRTRGAQK